MIISEALQRRELEQPLEPIISDGADISGCFTKSAVRRFLIVLKD